LAKESKGGVFFFSAVRPSIKKKGEYRVLAMIRGNPSNKAISSNSRAMGQGKRRRGLTILEKYEICKRRTESKENEKMKLEEFAKLFPGM